MTPFSMTRTHATSTARRRGFSLIEMLSAVAIIGVISFLAIPNLVRMRSDSERNLAIARAESINMAMATFIQSRGRTQAATDWAGTASAQARYALVAPYLSFSETNLTDYIPNGYTITFNTIDPLRKVTLRQGTATIAY
jgi:prepilin-type N-terminal cleavage/methylation domain-containing protein